MDAKDYVVNWFKELTGQPIDDGPTHIEKLYEKTAQEIMEGYEQAEDKEAYLKGVQAGDFGNTLGIQGPIYVAQGVFIFMGQVVVTGLNAGGMGTSGNANPALAINGNAALAMAGVEIAVADGNVVIIQPKGPVTDYYSNLKKATGEGEAETAKKPTSQNQMQNQVKKGQAPKGVDRVDPADNNIPGSQPHIHFGENEAALNQDGTWHDAGKPHPTITNKIEKWILETDGVYRLNRENGLNEVERKGRKQISGDNIIGLSDCKCENERRRYCS